MVKRSIEEWQRLFAEQAASGLSQAGFCREQGLCPKHFSVRKKQLDFQAKPTSSFVAVNVKPAVISSPSLQLQWRDCQLTLLGNTSPSWVSDLLKSLV